MSYHVFCEQCGERGVFRNRPGAKLSDMTCRCGGKFHPPARKQGFGYIINFGCLVRKKAHKDDLAQWDVGEWFGGEGTINPFVTPWGPLTAKVWKCKKEEWVTEVKRQIAELEDAWNETHEVIPGEIGETAAKQRYYEWSRGFTFSAILQ
jgi:hypothetical protein